MMRSSALMLALATCASAGLDPLPAAPRRDTTRGQQRAAPLYFRSPRGRARVSGETVSVLRASGSGYRAVATAHTGAERHAALVAALGSDYVPEAQ